MPTSNLRKVGGSVMLAVPPALLEQLRLEAGSPVVLSVENGSLVVKPNPAPRYTLEELLKQCDASAAISAEDEGWLDNGPVGNELL